jgi:2-keto-4-pentenoate hydratase/2-oxohepta-3-ene-1,7-dioic acid hydratase in catechol pathway
MKDAPSSIPRGEYRLLGVRRGNEVRAGVLAGNIVLDLADLAGRPEWAQTSGVLRDWDAANAFCESLAREDRLPGENARKLAECTLAAPVLYPGAIYCAGANYTDHVREMAKARGADPGPTMKELGEKPWHFQKAPRAAVVGPDAVIKAPPGCHRLDWEIELAVVIGRECRNVPAADFRSVVAGYMVANDLSARDLGRRAKLEPGALMYYDWIGHKNFDGSCPTGPWITPAKFVPDPNALDMKLWVNQELMQDSNTRQQIFDIGEQIEALSTQVTLFPGDLVLTGTPAGVGAARGRFLQPGDRVTLWMEGLGQFSHAIG